MLLDWIVLFKELTRQRETMRRDPLADPLMRPEWRGLGWFNALFERPAQRAEAAPHCPPKTQKPIAGQSQIFTPPASAATARPSG